jgi:hypothetical protein
MATKGYKFGIAGNSLLHQPDGKPSESSHLALRHDGPFTKRTRTGRCRVERRPILGCMCTNAASICGMIGLQARLLRNVVPMTYCLRKCRIRLGTCPIRLRQARDDTFGARGSKGVGMLSVQSRWRWEGGQAMRPTFLFCLGRVRGTFWSWAAFEVWQPQVVLCRLEKQD